MLFYNPLEGLDDQSGPSFSFFFSADRKRHFGAPNESMKLVHQRLNDLLASYEWLYLQNPLYMDCVAGCRRGKSPLAAVRQHADSRNRYYFGTDLKSAYRNVDMWYLAKLLSWALELEGEENLLFDFLVDYCEDPVVGGLVTGGPASPALFNLYTYLLVDLPLISRLKKWYPVTGYSMVYTRYLDDLVISSPEPLDQRRFWNGFQPILTRAGFKIRPRKTFWHDLERNPLQLCGVGIKPDRSLYLPRKERRELRDWIAHWDGSKRRFWQIVGRMNFYFQIAPPIDPEDKPNYRREALNGAERELEDAYHFLMIRVQASPDRYGYLYQFSKNELERFAREIWDWSGDYASLAHIEQRMELFWQAFPQASEHTEQQRKVVKCYSSLESQVAAQQEKNKSRLRQLLQEIEQQPIAVMPRHRRPVQEKLDFGE